MLFGGNDFLGLIISFLVLCGTLWVEVGFGGGGTCPCDVLADVFS